MIAQLENKPLQRCVISVCGGSGVGKSETASLLASQAHKAAAILSKSGQLLSYGEYRAMMETL
ncbi:hypothetical protein [uncultured Allofournierella sp.]|uniref:hypothetical protein n=1 Tax=uncultured Allofournierella sp. TaxID=1940258 RepID=UPI0037514DB3